MGRKKNPMTTRERFNKVLHWERPDRAPNMDFGYWNETFAVWHHQGLPKHINDNVALELHLGLEGESRIPALPLNNGLYPAFEYKILEDKGSTRIIRDVEGNICEVLKEGASIPHYIKYGLETRKDWELYKRERLDHKRPERIGDVKRAVEDAHSQGMPIRIHCGALYGWLRNWMGVENLSIAFMEHREWVEEMMDHITQMTLYLIEKTFSCLDIDVAWWWEDMCYNHGPLLSPKLFREIMVPRYREITGVLGKYGVDVNILDCDGKIYELVPGWLEAGITGMFPIEAIHTDPLKLREIYGRDVLLMGGVNKIAIAKGRDAIDREMERLHPLVEKGGYIPTMDHRVPPDVSYENYLYYLEKKKDIL